jgi:hypothetical protein
VRKTHRPFLKSDVVLTRTREAARAIGRMGNNDSKGIPAGPESVTRNGYLEPFEVCPDGGADGEGSISRATSDDEQDVGPPAA